MTVVPFRVAICQPSLYQLRAEKLMEVVVLVARQVITILLRVKVFGTDTTERKRYMRRMRNLDHPRVEKRTCEPYLEHRPWRTISGSIQRPCLWSR